MDLSTEMLEVEPEIFVTSDDDVGKRIDVFISGCLNITRSSATRLIEGGNVTVNGLICPKNLKLKADMTVSVILPSPEGAEILPENIPLNIVYEDNDIAVINKPKGMVVHPAAGNQSGTLVNALMYHCGDSLSGIGGVIRPGIVHRIDKDTSGLLVVAKNDAAHVFLSEQLKDHTLSRVYHAIVCGNIKEDRGTINAPIGRSLNDRKKMAVIKGSAVKSREAVTHFEVLSRFGDFTYVKCQLETGRTHQIRVHMASRGHSLLGDEVYGGSGTRFEAKNKELIKGQCLHAKSLTFIHPTLELEMTFEVPLPDYFDALLEKLQKTSLT